MRSSKLPCFIQSEQPEQDLLPEFRCRPENIYTKIFSAYAVNDLDLPDQTPSIARTRQAQCWRLRRDQNVFRSLRTVFAWSPKVEEAFCMGAWTLMHQIHPPPQTNAR